MCLIYAYYDIALDSISFLFLQSLFLLIFSSFSFSFLLFSDGGSRDICM